MKKNSYDNLSKEDLEEIASLKGFEMQDEIMTREELQHILSTASLDEMLSKIRQERPKEIINKVVSVELNAKRDTLDIKCEIKWYGKNMTHTYPYPFENFLKFLKSASEVHETKKQFFPLSLKKQPSKNND